MKMKLKMKLGAIALALIATGANATEWTRTVDYASSASTTVQVREIPERAKEAFWLDIDWAIDPQTGDDLALDALPQRLVHGAKLQRGRSWDIDIFQNVSYGAFFQIQYQTDSSGQVWGVNTFGLAPSPAVFRYTVDGRWNHWTPADLGSSLPYVGSLQTLVDTSGVLFMLSSDAGLREVVKLDGFGRVVLRQSVPACTHGVVDDRKGGFYARCGLNLIQRFAATPADSWSAPIAISAGLQRGDVTPTGGLLVKSASSGKWSSFDADGHLQFEVAADYASTAGGSFWFWQREGQVLRHLRADGSEIGRTQAIGVNVLLAHESGSALTMNDIPLQPGDPVARYELFSPSAVRVRQISSTRSLPTSRSRLRFAEHAFIAEAEGNSYQAQLIDSAGAAASRPFPIVPSSPDGSSTSVMADSNTLCTRTNTVIVPSPVQAPTQIRCFERASNRITIDRAFAGDAQLLGVGSSVLIRASDSILVFSPSGTQLASINVSDQVIYQFDFDANLGVATTGSDGTGCKLTRYRNDGSLAFTAPVTFENCGDVRLAADGSTFVAWRGIARFAENGRLLGERSDLGAPNDLSLRVLDVELGMTGIQMLLQGAWKQPPYTATNRPMFDALVVNLSDDLSQVTASYNLGSAWPNHATMRRSAVGDPRIVLANASSLRVFQYSSSTGLMLERRVLDPGNSNASRDGMSEQKRYDVDADGRVRLLAFDQTLQRDVLRISEPPRETFNGPIKQRAVAGSWFAPSSSGQGLLIELLNGNVLFGAWHTYAPEGGNSLAKQQWFTVTGEVSNERGRVTLPIYRNTQGRFDRVGSTVPQVVGTAELVFTSCDHLEFWYRIGDDSGAFPMQRLTPRTQACDDGTQILPGDDLAAGIDLGGAWFDPARSGQGFTFNTTGARFKSFLAGWFTYDTEAGVDDPEAQHWFTLQGATPDRYGQTVTANIHRTIGGSRAGAPTANSHRVGQAMLTVHDCASATLEYVFDNSAVAGSFADRSRSIELKRLGACPN